MNPATELAVRMLMANHIDSFDAVNENEPKRKGARSALFCVVLSGSAFKIEIVGLTHTIHHEGLELRHRAVLKLTHAFL